MGTVFFYKAFSVTFPGVDRRVYAWLIFLFPSILFWTAAVGKESAMLFALGLTAYGMAMVLARINRGYLYVLIGGAIGLVVRPNELVLLVGGFAIAMVVRALARGGQTRQVRRGPLRMIGAFVFVVGAVAIVGMSGAPRPDPPADDQCPRRRDRRRADDAVAEQHRERRPPIREQRSPVLAQPALLLA